jgi:hypothetical protein
MGQRSSTLGPARRVAGAVSVHEVPRTQSSPKAKFLESITTARNKEGRSDCNTAEARVKIQARLDEFETVIKMIGALAEGATSITLPSTLSDAAERVVDEAAMLAGFTIYYNVRDPRMAAPTLDSRVARTKEPLGPRTGQTSGKPQEAAAAAAVRIHLPVGGQDRDLQSQLPNPIWGIVSSYTDHVTNFELAGDPAFSAGLVDAEPNPWVRDVYKAKAKLAEVQALRAESLPQNRTSFDAAIEQAEVALTRALRACVERRVGFPDLFNAVRDGQVGLVKAHLAGLNGIHHLTTFKLLVECRGALMMAVSSAQPYLVTAVMNGLEGLRHKGDSLMQVVDCGRDDGRAVMSCLFRYKKDAVAAAKRSSQNIQKRVRHSSERSIGSRG